MKNDVGRHWALLTPFVACLAACAIFGQAASAAGACRDGRLAILLTNDDGFDRPGIQTLRDALAAAGHDVALAAPSHDYSGTGAALSLSGPIQVHEVGDHTFSIGATPATTVLLGAKVLFPAGKPPDLVVSRTNEGPNVGAATPYPAPSARRSPAHEAVRHDLGSRRRLLDAAGLALVPRALEVREALRVERGRG